MGITGPYIGQQVQKMCVVCGRLTPNDLVCDGCQTKKSTVNPGVARPAVYPTYEQGSQNDMPANMGWIVASVLSVLLAICFWYIFLRNGPMNGALSVTQNKPAEGIQAPSSLGAPAVQYSTPAPRSSTPQAPVISGASNVTSQQSGTYIPRGQAEIAQTDNISHQGMFGVSGPDAFIATFRKEYESDKPNQEYQSWDKYWESVRQFYAGGWQALGNQALGRIQGTARESIRMKWDSLGVSIGAECAKDDRVRKISAGDVSTFNDDLANAISVDNGDGSNIQRKLDEITKSVSGKKN